MNKKKVAFGATKFLAAGALLTALAAPPYASATIMQISFSGALGNGYANLTLNPDRKSSSKYKPKYNAYDGANNISHRLSKYDPAGAQSIIGASGAFDGIAITGVMPLDSGLAPPGEILPHSFSWIDTTTGENSYDNLFYANGSPLVCPPTTAGGGVGYPFSGGFLDIYGVMFTLQNGDALGLWSDGVTAPGAFVPQGGLTYGLDLFTPAATAGTYSLIDSDSQFAGVSASAPEPNSLWLFGAGVLGLFAWRRRAVAKRARGAAAWCWSHQAVCGNRAAVART
ncbi:MAG: PEP-CTERM sorting domain-containing protein [Steroidobacteraceae bacterium]